MLLEMTLMALTAVSKKDRKEKVLKPPPPLLASLLTISNSLTWQTLLTFLKGMEFLLSTSIF